MDKTVTFGSIPIFLAKIGAAVTSILKGGGITPTVIEVITQDEVVKTNADSEIGILIEQDTLEPYTKFLYPGTEVNLEGFISNAKLIIPVDNSTTSCGC